MANPATDNSIDTTDHPLFCPWCNAETITDEWGVWCDKCHWNCGAGEDPDCDGDGFVPHPRFITN